MSNFELTCFFLLFSLLECQCHNKAEENICEKVTGKCEDCRMGFYGDFCEKGNNEWKY